MPGGRYATLTETVRRVQLDPAEATEDSPIKLIIAVFDASDRTPLGKARVRLLLAGGASVEGFATGDDGSVLISLAPAKSKLARQGVAVEVNAASYLDSRTDIPLGMLKPSKEPVAYSVYLDSQPGPDLAALAAQIAKLEAIKQEILRMDAAAQEEESKAIEAEERARGIMHSWAADIGVEPGTNWGQLMQQRVAFCKASLEVAKTLETNATLATTEATTLLDAARQLAARCSNAGMAALVEQNYQQALRKAAELELGAKRARAQMEGFVKLAEQGEKEVDDNRAELEAVARKLREVADRAQTIAEGRQRKVVELNRGTQRLQPQLDGLRQRPRLKPEHYATIRALAARLQALRDLGEPARGPNYAVEAVDRMAARLAWAQRFSAQYGKQACRDARTLYPQVVERYEQDATALAFTLLQNNDLPAKAAACRKTAQAPTATPPPLALGASAAPAADEVEVPDLSQVPLKSMSGAVAARGLTWGGVSAAGNAPSADLEFKYAGQDPPAWSRRPRGTAVTVSLWQGPIAPPPAAVAAKPEQVTVPEPGPRGGVPNVVGTTLEQAVARLEAAGLRVGGITRGANPPTPDLAERIYFQSPAAGSASPASRAVALKQYGSLRETQAVVPTGDDICLTSEGPFGCTGRFHGTIATYPKDRHNPGVSGPVTLGLESDGRVSFTYRGYLGMWGTIDASGRIVVDDPQLRVEVQLRKVRTAGGGLKVAGTGSYSGKGSNPMDGSYSFPP